MSDLSRRHFLGASAVAVGAAYADDKPDPKKPSGDRLRVALVGCGGMGMANLNDFVRLPEFEPVALCDPDPGRMRAAASDLEKRLKSAGRTFKEPKLEKDFRKVVEDRDVDVVIVGTPDHWHAYVLIAACAAGKDVYCEKPLSHNIVEGRAMVDAAARHKRVVQIGTQQRSGKHFQDAVAYVRSGKLGHVYQCKTWISNNTPPAGAGSPPDGTPPDGVDYDLWLGPAPKRPFNPNRFHYQFRWFWDYGNGLCNDWGVHLNDIVLWGMKVQAPLSVAAHGGQLEIKDNADTPDTLDIYYEYPGFTHIYTVRRGKLPGFHNKSHGMEFVGTKGTLTLDRGGWFVMPADGGAVEKHGGSEQHFAHVQNFLHCVRNRDETPASAIEDMHRATTTCHLANISFKVKRRVYWDAEKERCYRGYDPATKKFVAEDAEANAYLLREPRKPWSLSS